MIGCGFGQLVAECTSNDANPGVPSYWLLDPTEPATEPSTPSGRSP